MKTHWLTRLFLCALLSSPFLALSGCGDDGEIEVDDELVQRSAVRAPLQL